MKKTILFYFVIMLFSCKKQANPIVPKSTEAKSTELKFTVQTDKTYTGLKANDFVILSDGSTVILGDARINSDLHLTLIKIGTDGNVVWTKTFDPANTYMANYAYSIQKDASDNLYLTSAQQPYNNNSDGRVSKINKDGTLVWDKIIAKATTEGMYGSGNCVIMPDGNVAVLFNPAEGSQSYCTVYFISATDGNQIRSFNVPNIVYAGDLKLASDGNIVIAGANFDAARTNTKLALTKINATGQVLWQTNTTSQAGGQLTYGLVELNNAFYLTGHYTAVNSNTRNFLFAKFDGTGAFNKMSDFGRSFDDVGMVIETLSDKAIVIGGYSQASKSTDLTGEVYLNVLDLDGNVISQSNLSGDGRIVAMRKIGTNTLIVLCDLGTAYRIIKYLY